MDSNVAAALSYLFMWVTGLVFLVIEEKDDFVRFHAAQSIVVFGGLTAGYVVISQFFVAMLFASNSFAIFRILQLLQLAGLVAWLLLMYKAYNGRWFRVPIAADIADDIISDSATPVQSRQPRRGQQTQTQQATPRQPSGQQQPRGQHSSGQPQSQGQQPTGQQQPQGQQRSGQRQSQGQQGSDTQQ